MNVDRSGHHVAHLEVEIRGGSNRWAAVTAMAGSQGLSAGYSEGMGLTVMRFRRCLLYRFTRCQDAIKHSDAGRPVAGYGKNAALLWKDGVALFKATV